MYVVVAQIALAAVTSAAPATALEDIGGVVGKKAAAADKTAESVGAQTDPTSFGGSGRY